MTSAVLPLHSHPEGVLVEVWVVPGAGRSEVTGLHAGALRVRVGAPAEGGRANRAAAALVARALGGRKGEVIAGEGSRRKQVLVPGVLVEAARRRLELVLAARGAAR
jgi:uncharacterized protein (TIGR00251 family)